MRASQVSRLDALFRFVWPLLFMSALPSVVASTVSPPAGPCSDPTEVTGVAFVDASRMTWNGVAGARGYNVYRGLEVRPPMFAGRCVYWATPEQMTLLDGAPAPGTLWTFQVTALSASGEGSMGFTSDCRPRVPFAACTCTLPLDPGPCDGVCPRWYFDPATAQCESFVWGCCGGNANNFSTQGECAATCLAPCTLPAVFGPCDAAVPRWYFSVLSVHCEPFTWGGCGGNANNFPDEGACRTRCGDLCFLPPDSGPCDGVCPRWYFNAASGQCEMFVWGCCGGNPNNFETRQACEAECAP